MRLYIVRHGDPDYENDTITPDGEREAKALSQTFLDKNISRIYTSPMGRAQKTASYTAEALGIEPVILEWTKELSHLRHDETPFGSVAAWDIPGEVYIPLQYGSYVKDEYGGFLPDESRIDPELAFVASESDGFLQQFGYERRGHCYKIDTKSAADEEQVILFCHNGFGLALLSHLLSIPYRLMWAGFWLAPTSVSTILFEKRSETLALPRALCIGDTSHLAKAGLEVKPRGIKANYL